MFSGEAFCLGKDFKELVVRKGKALPIETNEESCSMKLLLYEDAEYEVHSGGLGSAIWMEEINKHIEGFGKEIKKALIIGPTDSGKSTLTVLLANHALKKALAVGVLDGDVGQADLTPPSFIGCKILKEGIFDLRDLVADHVVAVGFIDVSFDEDFLIKCILKALEFLKNSDFIIINTDGYVEGQGIIYKRKLIKEVKPDAIFLIGDENLQARFSDLGFKIIPLSMPIGVSKSKLTRLMRREMQYSKFLHYLSKITLDLKETNLGFLGRIYSGLNIEGTTLIKKSEDGFKIKIYYSKEDTILVNEILNSVSLPSSVLEGMLVGIEKEGKITSYGILDKLNDTKLRIITDSKPPVNTVWLTSIRIVEGSEKKIPMTKIR